MTATKTLLPLVPLALALAGCANGDSRSKGPVSGHVEATEVRVAAKVGGRVLDLPVREGDTVKAGQLIARIDTTDTDLALRSAEAERDGAAAELALRERGARAEDIAEARANVALLDADLAGAQREFERMQGLLDTDSGTTKARDDAETRRDTARSRLAAARHSLERLEHGFRPEEIAASRARVAAANARIAQLQQQIKDATLVSPVAGVITQKATEAGELLAPGTLVAVITDLDDAWLTVFVGEPDLPRVRLGEEVEVVTDAGERRTARVTFISPTAEFTPKNVQTRDERVKLVYRLKLALPNTDGLFKPGMPAEARFLSAKAAR